MTRKLIVMFGLLLATCCMTFDAKSADAGWRYGWRGGYRGNYWNGGYRAYRPRYYSSYRPNIYRPNYYPYAGGYYHYY
jgi:hypothetical protein